MLACEPHLDAYLRQHLLVEQFIPGTEVAVEGMLYHGCLEILALFDKPDPLNGPFLKRLIILRRDALNRHNRPGYTRSSRPPVTPSG